MPSSKASHKKNKKRKSHSNHAHARKKHKHKEEEESDASDVANEAEAVIQDEEFIANLKILVKSLKQTPQLIHHKKLKFFSDYLEALGQVLRHAQQNFLADFLGELGVDLPAVLESKAASPSPAFNRIKKKKVSQVKPSKPIRGGVIRGPSKKKVKKLTMPKKVNRNRLVPNQQVSIAWAMDDGTKKWFDGTVLNVGYHTFQVRYKCDQQVHEHEVIGCEWREHWSNEETEDDQCESSILSEESDFSSSSDEYKPQQVSKQSKHKKTRAKTSTKKKSKGRKTQSR